MAWASRLRMSSVSSLWASIWPPSSQSSVSSRPVDKLRPRARHADKVDVREHVAIERDVLGLALVVELLADARADLLGDLGGVDRRLHAAVDGEDQVELLEVGFDRRLHVGILQLAGQCGAVMRPRAVHLAERRRGGGVMLEVGEFLLPVGPKLRNHAPLDEGPAHRRRLALQLGKLGDIFGRQRVRHGGHELRHLHDRALEAAERRRELHRVAATIEREPEEARTGHARGNAADIGADPRIAGSAGGKAVAFGVGHASQIVRRRGQSEASVAAQKSASFSRQVRHADF